MPEENAAPPYVKWNQPGYRCERLPKTTQDEKEFHTSLKNIKSRFSDPGTMDIERVAR
jgi:hypothetical protein